MGRTDLPTGQEAVDDWERSVERLVRAEERQRRMEELRESRGWLAKKLDLAPSRQDVDRARDESREARREERRTRRLVAELAVGARPERWDALSGRARFHLERTIGELLELDPAKLPTAVADELRGIRDSLHQARVEAHRGDRSLADGVALRLADALDEVADPPTRRKIMHHLPGDLRPIPGADPSTLEPRDFFDPRTVAFGEDLFHLADDRLSVSVTVTPK